MRGEVRLWLGYWLLMGLIMSCQAPTASDRTPSPTSKPPPVAVSVKTSEPAAMNKIASLIRDVIQRMHDDGVTPANVATRAPTDYSNPLVRVDAEGRIHTDITWLADKTG